MAIIADASGKPRVLGEGAFGQARSHPSLRRANRGHPCLCTWAALRQQPNSQRMAAQCGSDAACVNHGNNQVCDL